jgi:hypothetical protein
MFQIEIEIAIVIDFDSDFTPDGTMIEAGKNGNDILSKRYD